MKLKLAILLFTNIWIANTKATPVDSLLNIAKKQFLIGDFVSAKEKMKEAFYVSKTNTEKARILNNLGILFQYQYSYDSALFHYTKAEKIFERTNDTNNLVKILNNKAIIYKSLKDNKRSLDYYQKALIISSVNQEFNLLNNIGSLYLSLNQYDSCLFYLKKAEKCVPRREKLFLFKNIAYTYSKLNDKETSDQYFKKAFSYKENASTYDYLDLLIGYGGFFNDKDSIKKAIRYAKRIKAKSIELKAFYSLAFTCREPDSCLFYLQKVATNEQPSNSLNAWINIDALNEIANIYYKQNKLRNALKYYQIAIEKFIYNKRIFTSNEDKKEINDKYANLFISAAEVCLKLYEQNQNDSLLHLAFDYADMIKASNFKEQVKNRAIPDSVLLAERRLNAQIEQGKPGAVIEKEKFIETIKNSYPAYYENRFSYKIGLAKELPGRLNNSQQVISYIYSDSLFQQFIVTNKGISVRTFKIDSSFFNAVNFTAFYIRTLETNAKQYRDFVDASNYLYRLFFTPQMKKELVIIPWKNLYKISFDGLFTTQKQPRDLNFDLPYLVYNHAVSYHYAAGLLKFNKRKAKTAHLYAPDYRDTGKEPLNIEGDVKAIENFTAPKKVSSVELLGDIFHLTVHGVPGYVYTQDDSISINDILSMQSANKLTMLTACYSAEGQINAEGKESFARALLQAGSESAVVSEWNLASLHNQIVFDVFYKELKRGESLTIALQKGKIHYLNKMFAHELHPYFWACLSLYGNTSALEENRAIWYIAPGIILLILVFFFVFKYFRR